MAFLTEFSLAARRLLRARVFAVSALGILAIGLGVAGCVFALVQRVVLQPLPFPNSDRLAVLKTMVPGIQTNEIWGVAAHEARYFKTAATKLSDIAVYNEADLNVQGSPDQQAERSHAALVSANLLHLLGIVPQLGREFQPADNAPTVFQVAILGATYWRSHFGGDPAVIGKRLSIEGAPVTVVGVMPNETDLPDARVDVWLPLAMDSTAPPVNQHNLHAIARLKPGATLSAAQLQLNQLTRRLPELYPTVYPRSFWAKAQFRTRIMSLKEDVVGTKVIRALWIVLVGVALLLIIAAANVANLMLVRLETRRAELTLRVALGLDRIRLGAHLLSEPLLICLCAAAVAIILANTLLSLVLHLTVAVVPQLDAGTLAIPLVAFVMVASLVLAVVLGALPLVGPLRVETDSTALKASGRTLGLNTVRLRVRNALIIAQVGFAVVLMSCAGLLVRTFEQLRHVNLGFNPTSVVAISIMPPVMRYQESDQIAALYESLVERVGAAPSVAAAAVAQFVPMDPVVENGWCQNIRPEGIRPDEQPPCVAAMQVSPGYFDALRIHVQGHVPDWSETKNRLAGVVVSRSLATRLWPGMSALGRGVRAFAGGTAYYRVVGVADDVYGNGPNEAPTEAAYFPLRASPGAPLWSPQEMTLVVRSRDSSQAAVLPYTRSALSEIDRSVAVGPAQDMTALLDRATARQSFAMSMLLLSAMVAFLLSAVGLYSLVAFFVAERRGEIGIRMALGADVGRITRMILGQSTRLATGGIVTGVCIVVVISRWTRSLLFNVSAIDPLSLGLVASLVFVVTLLAAVIPARSAGRIDPTEALRNQ